MLRRLLIVAASIIMLSALASEPGRYTINGNVSNVPDGSALKLYKPDGNLLTVMAQDTIVDGHFCFTDTISGPVKLFYLSSDSPGFPNRLARVMVGPGAEITVTGQGPLYPLWHFSSNIPRQESIGRFTAAIMPEFEDYLRLDAEESELMKFLYVEKKGAEEYVEPTWQKIDSLRRLAKPFSQAMDRKEIEYTAQAPVDEEWLDKYRSYVSQVFRNPDAENADAIRSLYARLSEDDLATTDGQTIRQWMEMGKKLSEGNNLPQVELTDSAGKVHTLAEFPGKHILIDFWSGGCGPCIQAIPETEEVAEMYDSCLAVVSVSQDPIGVWKKFLDSRGLKGIQWNGYVKKGTSLYDRFGSNGIPTYVLVSPDGKIISVWSGYGPGSLKKALARHMTTLANPDPE